MNATLTSTTRQTVEETIAQLTTYRRHLRSEARRTVDERSRVDRLADIGHVTMQLGRMYDILDAMDADEEATTVTHVMTGEVVCGTLKSHREGIAVNKALLGLADGSSRWVPYLKPESK